MTDNPDYRALLRGICEQPENDTRRLAAADWLDERGDASRAEFIRAQCELTRMPGCLTPSEGSWPCYRLRPRDKSDCLPWCAACCRRGDLKKLERPWLEKTRRAVAAEIGLNVDVWLARQLTDVVEPGTPLVALDRGFVSEVRCTQAAFLEHAATIFRTNPVTTVVLTDVTLDLFASGQGIRLSAGFPAELAATLKPFSGGRWAIYAQRGEIERDISRVCVQYGRGRAGESL